MHQSLMRWKIRVRRIIRAREMLNLRCIVGYKQWRRCQEMGLLMTFWALISYFISQRSDVPAYTRSLVRAFTFGVRK